MSCTNQTVQRRRRIIAAALALPLSLGMVSTAYATGPAEEPRGAAETSSLRVADAGKSAGKPADKPAPAKAEAAQAAAAEKADLRVADAPKPANKPAESKAEKASEKAPEKKAPEKKADPGSAAGAASGKSAATATRDSSSDPAKHGTPTAGPLSKPQPLSNADKNGTGANPGETCTHAYCSTRDGSASGNGKGDGNANGKPCAGCVGKADNKNPKGQAPNGSDANAGYECDRNQGIGKTNPAHTGCTPSSTSPTQTPKPKPTRTPKPTVTRSPNGPGTATMTVLADCRTVVVTSTKDISNVVVFFADGTSTKFDGLTGKSWTKTFTKDVSSARAKSATTVVTANASGCGGGGGVVDVCPDMDGNQPAGTVCKKGGNNNGGGGNEMMSICHATGSATNPYVLIASISKAGVVNGHYGVDHQGARDIIPAFTYKGVSYPAQGNQALLGTGCVAGGPATFDQCPDMPGNQPAGTTCTIGGGGGGGAEYDNCPDMPGNQPANTVCTVGSPNPTPVPPTEGGGTPISGTPPGQPATNPVPGAPTLVPPVIVPNNAVSPLIIGGGSVLPVNRPISARAVPSALPFTGGEAALIAQLGLILLLAGVGVGVAARRGRTAV